MQIPIEASDVHKTVVITLFGLFEFVKMPFGLHNTAQTFQRFIDMVLHGLMPTSITSLLQANPPSPPANGV